LFLRKFNMYPSINGLTEQKKLLENAKKDEYILSLKKPILAVRMVGNNVFEFKLGGTKVGATYINRSGSPGNYIYHYLPKSFSKFGRKTSFAYGRLIKNSMRFINMYKTRYGAMRVEMKPKTWYTSVVDFKMEDGGWITHLIDLKNKKTMAYKIRREPSGGSTQINKLKKAGVLRYR